MPVDAPSHSLDHVWKSEMVRLASCLGMPCPEGGRDEDVRVENDRCQAWVQVTQRQTFDKYARVAGTPTEHEINGWYRGVLFVRYRDRRTGELIAPIKQEGYWLANGELMCDRVATLIKEALREHSEASTS